MTTNVKLQFEFDHSMQKEMIDQQTFSNNLFINLYDWPSIFW